MKIFFVLIKIVLFLFFETYLFISNLSKYRVFFIYLSLITFYYKLLELINIFLIV
ncbi:MAG: hypothetical protein PWP28_1533 [Oceanotoga sp.]|nr:hypothetical protein [Oceanotoga sp.]